MLGAMEHDPHTTARRGAHAGAMRFPCGHTEPDDSVGRRLRITARAAWIACVRCNVVALVVGPSAGAPAPRRVRHSRPST
jgi:hypothetical protein